MLCIFVNSRACLVLLVNIFPQQILPMSASSVDLAIVAEFLPRKTDTEDIIDAKRRKITVPWQECDWMDGWIVGWAWRVGSWGHQEAATFGQIGNGAREAAGHFYQKLKKYEETRKPWRYQKSLDSCRFLPSCQTNWQKFFYKKARGIQRQPCELGPLGITMACWNPGGQHPQQVWLHVRKAQG